MEAKLRLNEGMQFVGTSDSGHALLLDSVPEAGGSDSATRPVEAVLLALGGCTGMDVVSLLRKMKQEFTDFELKLEAERAGDHPQVLTEVHIIYRVWGGVEKEKLTKAIDLSLEKYCSVANSLKPNVDIGYEFRIFD